MRVKIPTFAEKSQLFAYLRTNESKIIKQKKSLPIKSDIFEWGCLPVNTKSRIKSGADGGMLGPDEIEINQIANLSGWCDTYMDVMIKDNWNKTITDKAIIYPLKNHDYSTDAIIGRDAELYTKNFDLSYFNIESDVKNAQALMMRFICVKEYDQKTYYLYRDGQIKQTSIGLIYIQLSLCLNSDAEEDATYKKNWDKYYPKVINKTTVDNYGYFFAVTESRILEDSCVLFGACEPTGVYSTSEKAKQADDESPDNEPDDDPDDTEAADKALQESKKKFYYCN